jgi:hypothetical protein
VLGLLVYPALRLSEARPDIPALSVSGAPIPLFSRATTACFAAALAWFPAWFVARAAPTPCARALPLALVLAAAALAAQAAFVP